MEMITSAFALLSVLAAVVGKIYPFAATGVLFEAGETPYRAEDTFALDAATGRGKFRGVHAGAFAKPERSSFNPVFPVIAKGVATGAYARDVGGLPGRIQQVNNISPGAYTRPGSGPYTGVFEEDEGLISPGADFASSTGIEDEPYTDYGFPSMNVANAANEELSVLFPGSGVDSSVGIDTGRGTRYIKCTSGSRKETFIHQRQCTAKGE
ncbi:uncharacterized protein [Panulirus ornatus]|uniref:uncharacterized protein n=1 Tax=Panulirus ornatus TaxID=150431 RepID=UPI003A87D8AA